MPNNRFNPLPNNEWESSIEAKDLNRYKAIANNTHKKETHIDVCLSDMDLELLQERAQLEGITYQNLISTVLHQYATGHLASHNL